MKKINYLICLILIFSQCEKTVKIAEDDNLNFCPIYWKITPAYAVQNIWAVSSYANYSVQDGKLTWETSLPTFQAADISYVKFMKDSTFQWVATAQKSEFSITFKKTVFDTNCTFQVAACKRPLYTSQLIGRYDSVAAVAMTLKKDGFLIIGTANNQTILLGEKLPDFKKAVLSLVRLTDRWQFSCELFDDSNPTTPFFTAKKELFEVVFEKMFVGVNTFYTSPINKGETGKMKLLFQNFTIKLDDEAPIVDNFDCNTLINY
jgi:hypothetical protein